MVGVFSAEELERIRRASLATVGARLPRLYIKEK